MVSNIGSRNEHRESALIAIGRELGLTSSGDSNVVITVQRYGIVCAQESEYYRSIHRETTNYGPMQGDVTDAGGAGCLLSFVFSSGHRV